MVRYQDFTSLGISFVVYVCFVHCVHHPFVVDSIYLVLLCALILYIVDNDTHQIRLNCFDPQNLSVFEREAQNVVVGNFVSFIGALVLQRRFCLLFG